MHWPGSFSSKSECICLHLSPAWCLFVDFSAEWFCTGSACMFLHLSPTWCLLSGALVVSFCNMCLFISLLFDFPCLGHELPARYPGKRSCFSTLCVCVLPPRPDNEIKRKKHDEVMPVPDFSPCDFRLYEGNSLILTSIFCSEKLVSSLETDHKVPPRICRFFGHPAVVPPCHFTPRSPRWTRL